LSEVAHDNWKMVKTNHKFLELLYSRGESCLECYNQATHDYMTMSGYCCFHSYIVWMNNDWLSLLCLIMSSPPVFSGVRVNRSLVLCVMFCRSLFVLLYFFVWPLCSLFFFGLRILITSLWYLQTFLDRRWMDV